MCRGGGELSTRVLNIPHVLLGECWCWVSWVGGGRGRGAKEGQWMQQGRVGRRGVLKREVCRTVGAVSNVCFKI